MTVENESALDDNMPPMDIDPVVTNDEVKEVTDASPAEVSSEQPQEIEIDEKQKALNQLAFEKREAKREAKALEEEVARLRAQIPQVAQVSGEPTLEQFDYDEQAYNSALISYKVKQETQAIITQQEQRLAVQRQQEKQAGFNAKVAKLTEKATDYAEVVGKLPDLPQETLNAILEADNGPNLAYYLGKHLDIADLIAGASPMVAAMKLGEISAQLSNVKPVNKPSAAPDPIVAVDSSGSLSKSMDEMSMDEIYSL